MLKHSAVTSPLQRSHACIIAAEMCARIGEPQETRNWYLKAIGEWAAWCEPHYAIGVFCYEIAVRQKQEGAPNDVVHALFVEAAGWLLASTVHEPPAYFVDMTIYAWKRYQALSVALGQLGRLAEAHLWMQRAIAGEPASEELKQQLLIIEEAMPDEVQAAVKS
jgi:hypothetical protein